MPLFIVILVVYGVVFSVFARKMCCLVVVLLYGCIAYLFFCIVCLVCCFACLCWFSY